MRLTMSYARVSGVSGRAFRCTRSLGCGAELKEKQGRLLHERSACGGWMIERSKEDGERKEQIEYIPC